MSDRENRKALWIVFLLSFISQTFIFSQTQEECELYIQRHWVKNYSGNRLFLTPYDSTDTDLSADIKYSGWVFLKDGVYIQKTHRWCGNHNGPTEYTGTWSITGHKDDFTLTMVDGKYLMTYKIFDLKKDKIVLLKED